MRRVAADFARAVGKVIYPKIAAFAKKPVEDRVDAEPEDPDLGDLMDEADAAAARSFDQAALESSTNVSAKRTVKHSQNEFQRLGIDLRKGEPKLGKKIDSWRKQCVDRIRSVEQDQLGKIRRILADGENHRHETLAKEIERQLEDVTRSQAELIARDQVLSLNALITQERQTAAGIAEFVWTTSGDERVREEHQELEGQTFSWEDGGDPEEGIPGEAVNCRCVAFPILPELDDKEEPDEDT